MLFIIWHCFFDKRWSSPDAGKLLIFSFFIQTISFPVAEKSVHMSFRLLVCVCTFLLLDKKNRQWPPGFRWYLFQFLCRKFPDLQDNKMFVFFFIHIIFEISAEISIFLAFSDSFAVKNDKSHLFFAVLVLNFYFTGFAPKQKYTDWMFPWKRSDCKIPTKN